MLESGMGPEKFIPQFHNIDLSTVPIAIFLAQYELNRWMEQKLTATQLAVSVRKSKNNRVPSWYMARCPIHHPHRFNLSVQERDIL